MRFLRIFDSKDEERREELDMLLKEDTNKISQPSRKAARLELNLSISASLALAARKMWGYQMANCNCEPILTL